MRLAYGRPTGALASELNEVAEAAQELLSTVGSRSNIPLPDEFPSSQLIAICQSLIGLPGGTSEGCRAPLEYAQRRLPQIRREHIKIEKTNTASEVLTRGTVLDIKLASLISAVLTAWDEYRRAAVEDDEGIAPEAGAAPPAGSTDRAVEQSIALETALSDAQRELKEITEPESVAADDLKRQLEDMNGVNRLGGAEMRMPKLVPEWLRRVTNSLKNYPAIIRETANRLRVGVDVISAVADRWHEFEHNGVRFILDKVRKTIDCGEEIATIVEASRSRAANDEQGDFSSVTRACISILTARGSPMSARDILVEMEKTAKGRALTKQFPAVKPYKRVSSALTQRAQKFGDVIRIGGGFWSLSKRLAPGEAKKLRLAQKTPEQQCHIENTKAGMEAHRERGGRVGRERIITPEMDLKLRKLAADGVTFSVAAEALGIAPSAVQNWERRTGILLGRRHKRKMR